MATSGDFDPTSVNLTDPNVDLREIICSLQTSGNEYNGNLGARISSIFVIFVVSTAVTLFPVVARRKPSWRIPAGLYTFARYVGTGVIIATAFIHLLDPAYEEIGGASCVGLTGYWAEFPWCPALVLFGAVMTFLTELGAKCYIDEKYGVQTEREIRKMVVRQPDPAAHGSCGVLEPSCGQLKTNAGEKPTDVPELEDWESLKKMAYMQQIGAFLILEFGIIFHSVIIGLNLGVVGEEFNTLYPVLVFHQSFEGLGIGARMALIPFPGKRNWLPWILCLAYGLTTPLSIAIGLGLRTTYEPNSFTANVVSGVLDSLSAGILIYTGFVDLLARDFLFECDRTRHIKQLVQMVFYTLLGAVTAPLDDLANDASEGNGELTQAKALPVTLLSGFLGAGKTTLLQHILKSNHGLRIAVIVNDMAGINIDAALVKETYRLKKSDEKVIALQNGGICCNLRGDLLEEILDLWKLQAFDYIIIESSGISGPEQVAETFDSRLSESLVGHKQLDEYTLETLDAIKKAGGLEKVARLDTTVTVINAFTVIREFHTDELLSGRQDNVSAEDERIVSDLIVD